MKLCFISHGDVKTLATLKRAFGTAGPLIEAGHQVAIVMADTPFNRHRLALECPDATALFYRGGSARTEVRDKRRLIRQFDPDVVYVCSLGMRNWVARPFRGKRPIYLVEHSELRSGIAAQPLRRRWFERGIEWCSILLYDGELCASRYLEKLFTRMARRIRPRLPIFYTPYAYNRQVLESRPVDPELQARYAGKRVILYMGTLAANYGILDMLSAIRALRQQRDDFVFLILGPGGRHKDIATQMIRDEGMEAYTSMMGYIPEDKLADYLNIANIFISPLYDTVQDWARCPSKLFMYLPFGKPIVTCRIGEALELFGDNGFYYQTGDVPGLTAEVNRALDHAAAGKPCAYDPQAHTWHARTRDLLDWMKTTYGACAGL